VTQEKVSVSKPTESIQSPYVAASHHVTLPAAGVIDMGHKLLQTAVMHAMAAVVRPYGVHIRLYQHSVLTHLSPQRSSPVDRSAPLGRQVSGDGVL